VANNAENVTGWYEGAAVVQELSFPNKVKPCTSYPLHGMMYLAPYRLDVPKMIAIN
jgi:hypothetical protein